MFVRGKEIPPPVDNIIKLFVLCEAMKWTHLPMPGGLFNQNPIMLDRFYYIMAERSQEEERKSKAEERKKGGPGGSPKRVAGGRRRR